MCLLVYQNVFICGVLTFAVSLSPTLHFLFKTIQMIHILQFSIVEVSLGFFMDVPPYIYIVHIYLSFALTLVFKIQPEHSHTCPFYNKQQKGSLIEESS